MAAEGEPPCPPYRCRIGPSTLVPTGWITEIASRIRRWYRFLYNTRLLSLLLHTWHITRIAASFWIRAARGPVPASDWPPFVTRMLAVLWLHPHNAVVEVRVGAKHRVRITFP